MEILKNYIDGDFCLSVNEQFLDNYEPATGKIYSQLPDSDEADIAKAIESSKKSFLLWSQSSIKERSDILLDIAHHIDINSEELAYHESKDQGKPFWLAKEMDIPRAAENFRFFATAVKHQENKSFHDKNLLNYTRYEPSGVCGLIAPWNLPLYLLTWKIAPCLSVGNTAVCKPSELTPMTAFKLAHIFEKVGLPKGVCNIVFGSGEKAGRPLVKHKDVPVISFTGGTKTAQTIIQDSSHFHKKLGLELGGKNPSLIFADCDLDSCIKTHIRSAFLNQGEICLCTSRVYVEEKIYSKFVKLFVDEVKKIKVHSNSDHKPFMGALISESHLNKVLYYVELAQKEGARILCGGKKISLEEPYAKGYHMKPTVIEGLSQTSRVVQEEIFGPVALVFPFKNENEAIRLANQSSYGLASTIWTQNLTKAHKIAQQIQTGQVWINTWLKRDLRTPFGGMKSSGLGREGGYYGCELYCEQKNIAISL